MDKQTQKELLNLVEKNFNEIAEHFSETRRKELWPELIRLVKDVKSGAKVLDIGCGSGRLLEAFIGREIDYLGVDKSEKLLKNARAKYPNNKFRNGDILEMGKIPEYDFDYIFCIAVLHHIPSKELRIEALRQLGNKIKKDGKIVIMVWNMWSTEWKIKNKKNFKKMVFKYWLLKLIGKNKMDFGDILFDWKNSDGEAVSQRYYHVFNKRELRRICRKAKLKIKKIYKDKYNYYLVLKKRNENIKRKF
jgi:2-polyprenyl-3-methyl-5-hydroxy-6-metoxy-1,4-benzoquinol methylase